jgi:hypothetical protein
LVVPEGRVWGVVIVRPGEIVSLNAWVAEEEVLSVTRTVKFEVTGVVGVPVIVPGLDSVSPDGRAPEMTDQV